MSDERVSDDASAVNKACDVFRALGMPSERASDIFNGLHRVGVVLMSVSNMSYSRSNEEFTAVEVALLKAGYTLNEAMDIINAIHEAGMIIHKVEQ